MTTYYRGEPTRVSERGWARGRAVLKETSDSRRQQSSSPSDAQEHGPVPRTYASPCGHEVDCPAWRAGARVDVRDGRDEPAPGGRTFACAAASFAGDGRPRSWSPRTASDSSATRSPSRPPRPERGRRRPGAHSLPPLPSARNERAFDDWFARNVPRWRRRTPICADVLLRWFVVRRAHTGGADRRPRYRARPYYEAERQLFNCVVGLPVPVQSVKRGGCATRRSIRGHVLNWSRGARYRGYISSPTRHRRAEENHPSRAFAARVYLAVKATPEAAGGAGNLPPARQWRWGPSTPNFSSSRTKWATGTTADSAEAGLDIARLVRPTRSST